MKNKLSIILVVFLALLTSCSTPPEISADNIIGSENMTDLTRSIVDFLGCECIVLVNQPSVKEVFEKFDIIANQGKAEGFTPLIILPSETLCDSFSIGFDEPEMRNTEEFRDKEINEALNINVEDFFKARLEEYSEFIDDEEFLGSFSAEEEFAKGDYLYNYDEIIIAKFPTANPWELPIYFPMGGFNECPWVSEQAAVFKYWYDKYGAVPVFSDYASWQLRVEKNTLTKKEAEKLAYEMFAFCSDTVFQGADSIRGLAKMLTSSDYWSIWWD